MATLEQQRRASGARMEAERRASGARMEAQRRAGGEAMVKRRTGRDEVEDVNALVRMPRQRAQLRSVPASGGLPAQVGTGVYQAPAKSTGGGGIAGPLTEVAASRTYHTRNVVIRSVDGAVFMQVKMPASVSMMDANGEVVVFNYADVTTG